MRSGLLEALSASAGWNVRLVIKDRVIEAVSEAQVIHAAGIAAGQTLAVNIASRAVGRAELLHLAGAFPGHQIAPLASTRRASKYSFARSTMPLDSGVAALAEQRTDAESAPEGLELGGEGHLPTPPSPDRPLLVPDHRPGQSTELAQHLEVPRRARHRSGGTGSSRRR